MSITRCGHFLDSCCPTCGCVVVRYGMNDQSLISGVACWPDQAQSAPPPFTTDGGDALNGFNTTIFWKRRCLKCAHGFGSVEVLIPSQLPKDPWLLFDEDPPDIIGVSVAVINLPAPDALGLNRWILFRHTGVEIGHITVDIDTILLEYFPLQNQDQPRPHTTIWNQAIESVAQVFRMHEHIFGTSAQWYRGPIVPPRRAPQGEWQSCTEPS